jgi:alkanesulfonate monooxygenase SsuD/methylene tetrahydromethanopterin reductase-like flavin-dependent oxidoreductase (luciferase family)
MLGGDPLTTAHETRLLEERGFSAVWFPHVPTIGWGDPYICLALAAAASSRIRVGTAVVPARLRAMPELINAIATVNRIAPGRVNFGYASGSFSRAVLGLPLLKVADMHDDLALIRALLDEREAIYEGQRVRFHPWPRDCIDLDAPIAVIVGAGGLRTAALAGRFGDGLITSGELRPDKLRLLLESATEATRAAGRSLTHFPFIADVGPLCLVRAGEAIDSARIVAAVQPAISGYFGFFAMQGLPTDAIDVTMADDYRRYLGWVTERYGAALGDRMFGLSERYAGRDPSHDRFVSAASIRACSLTGSLEEVTARLQDVERAGVTQVSLLRPFDRAFEDDDDLRDLVAIMERVG